MKFKKRIAFFLLSAFLCAPAFAGTPDKNIVIIYTNDVHCAVEENIGYAGLAFYRNEMKKQTPYVTLVDAGDAVQGAPIGTISNGRYIIEIMNAMSYDVAVPGNHEFDFGMGQIEDFAKTLKCGYVSCNFRDTVKDQLVFEPYKMIAYGDTRVAFVGVCTPMSITSSSLLSFVDDQGNFIYDFDSDSKGEKLCASIQRAVDNARKEGADFVILVAHLGGYKKNIPQVWTSPYLVQRLRGIDAVIDGHSHEVLPSLNVRDLDGREIPVMQTGTKLKHIGQLTIDTEGKITTELIDSVSGQDEKIAAFIRGIEARYEEKQKTRLGHADFDLLAGEKGIGWHHRNAETNLCNFVTDAFLEASEGKAEIALVNAGGVQATLKAGELIYNDALRVFPFGNTLCICDVPGQTLLDELEFGASLMPEEFGGLLHTAGLSYTIDATIPTPVQVDDKKRFVGVSDAPRRVRNVMINGKPLDPDRIYSVISVSFVLLNGGDGHRFEKARLTRPDFITAADALALYIKKFPAIPKVYRTPQGRLLTGPGLADAPGE